jgi:uncharacterized protein YajQ (UPF0234 family)
MPSFDTVLEADLVKVKNSVENTAKEIGTRFDFKGTAAAIELKEKEITLIGDSDFQIDQITDILRNKATKSGVDVRFFDAGKVEKIGGDKVKVQASIQGDAVRVTGKNRDDLQEAMALIKADLPDMPLSFNNFRD